MGPGTRLRKTGRHPYRTGRFGQVPFLPIPLTDAQFATLPPTMHCFTVARRRRLSAFNQSSAKTFTGRRENLWISRSSPKVPLTTSTSRQARPMPGVLAVKAPRNPFATVVTKAPDFLRCRSRPKRPKRLSFAAARKPEASRFATAAIRPRDGISRKTNFSTRFRFLPLPEAGRSRGRARVRSRRLFDI